MVPVFLRFKDDLNIHERKWATHICEKRGLKLLEVDFDIYEFLNSGQHLDYGALTGVRSPQIAALLWLADYILEQGGFFVFSGDAVLGRLKNKVEPEWEGTESSLEKNINFYSGPSGVLMAFEKLKQIRGAVGVSSYLSFSSYQVASSLTLIDPADFDKLNTDLNSRLRKKIFNSVAYYRQLEKIALLKQALFSKVGFSIEEREMKYTGYELIHDKESKNEVGQEPLHRRIQGLNKFNEKYRRPLEELSPSEYLHSFRFGKNLTNYVASFFKSLSPSIGLENKNLNSSV
ncbi:MAG: hypothetical protein R2827_08340 [Bdellovibrionales bacterium]